MVAVTWRRGCGARLRGLCLSSQRREEAACVHDDAQTAEGSETNRIESELSWKKIKRSHRGIVPSQRERRGSHQRWTSTKRPLRSPPAAGP